MYHLFRYFNSQPHEEADGYNNYTRFARDDFNSQPHEEADTDDATFHGME